MIYLLTQPPHTVLQATTQRIELLQQASISPCQEDRSENKYEKNILQEKKKKKWKDFFFFAQMLSREVWLLLEVRKKQKGSFMTKSQDMRKPHLSKTGSAKTQTSLSLSCCSEPHIYHTATSPARKDPNRQPQRGAWFARVTRWPWIPENGSSGGWKETLSWPLWLHALSHVKVEWMFKERQTTGQMFVCWIFIVGHIKRRKATLGGIWPQAIKHTVLSSFTLFIQEKMNRMGKVERVGERKRERESKMEQTAL